MTSRIIRPVDRMLLDFSSTAAAGTALPVFLARRINVTPFKEVTAYLRFHPGTTMTATLNTSDFVVNADGYTDDDPGALDGTSTSLPAFQTQLSKVDCHSVTTYGGMFVLPVIATGSTIGHFGSLLSLQWNLRVTTAGTIRYVVSVDLICKEF